MKKLKKKQQQQQLQLQEGFYWWNKETFWYQKERTSGWIRKIGYKEIYQNNSERFRIQTNQIFYCWPCYKWESLNKLGGIQHFGYGQWKKYKKDQGIHLDKNERRKQQVNADKKAYQLSHLYDQPIHRASSKKKRWCHSIKTRISCQCSWRKHPMKRHY